MQHLSPVIFAKFEDNGIELIADPADCQILLGNVGALVKPVGSGEQRLCFFESDTALAIGPKAVALARIEAESHERVLQLYHFDSAPEGSECRFWANGHVFWENNTLRDFETVNGVAARGGSLGQPGSTVAGGMLFVGSGYAGVLGGMPGNVLLAFGR